MALPEADAALLGVSALLPLAVAHADTEWLAVAPAEVDCVSVPLPHAEPDAVALPEPEAAGLGVGAPLPLTVEHTVTESVGVALAD